MRDCESVYLKVHMGNGLCLIPILDFIDMVALQSGLGGYEEALSRGYRIECGSSFYDKKGNDITSDVDIEAVYKQIKDCVNEKQLYVESYNHMQI